MFASRSLLKHGFRPSIVTSLALFSAYRHSDPFSPPSLPRIVFMDCKQVPNSLIVARLRWEWRSRKGSKDCDLPFVVIRDQPASSVKSYIQELWKSYQGKDNPSVENILVLDLPAPPLNHYRPDTRVTRLDGLNPWEGVTSLESAYVLAPHDKWQILVQALHQSLEVGCSYDVSFHAQLAWVVYHIAPCDKLVDKILWAMEQDLQKLAGCYSIPLVDKDDGTREIDWPKVSSTLGVDVLRPSK